VGVLAGLVLVGSLEAQVVLVVAELVPLGEVEAELGLGVGVSQGGVVKGLRRG